MDSDLMRMSLQRFKPGMSWTSALHVRGVIVRMALNWRIAKRTNEVVTDWSAFASVCLEVDFWSRRLTEFDPRLRVAIALQRQWEWQ